MNPAAASAQAPQSPSESPLTALLSRAQARAYLSVVYAGEVLPAEVFAFLQEHEGVVVDVRTPPEWQFVGTPNLAGTKGEFLPLSWKTYPQFITNPHFEASLATTPGISKETPLFFICRSGGRSLDAAVAMTQAGYLHCFNITGGFEGEVDATGKRATTDGWKAAGLPWGQS